MEYLPYQEFYAFPQNLIHITINLRITDIVVHRGERIDVYRVLVGKPEGKRPLGRPRHRWEDNIKMDLQKWDVGVGTGSSWLRIGTGGGHL